LIRPIRRSPSNVAFVGWMRYEDDFRTRRTKKYGRETIDRREPAIESAQLQLRGSKSTSEVERRRPLIFTREGRGTQTKGFRIPTIAFMRAGFGLAYA
jgi:hypothetical protein